MIPFPNIDPTIIKIGPLPIRWYGVMYLLGFIISYFLVKYQLKKKRAVIDIKDLDSFYLFLMIGLVLGARLGYVLFYDLSAYLENPIEIFAVWHGGMSFHGGLVGVITAGKIFSVKKNLDFWKLSDTVIVTAPIGLGFGRLGNFINGELYGRATDVPWGMLFPTGGLSPRHPSQIYEFLLEGITLFVLLWFLKDRNLRSGMLTALFLVFYSIFRFSIEFFREPDYQLGFIISIFTMGQVLSVFMFLLGIATFLFVLKR